MKRLEVRFEYDGNQYYHTNVVTLCDSITRALFPQIKRWKSVIFELHDVEDDVEGLLITLCKPMDAFYLRWEGGGYTDQVFGGVTDKFLEKELKLEPNKRYGYIVKVRKG